MIIAALSPSQRGFSSLPAARRSRKPMSSRGRQPSSDRRARARPAHTRDQIPPAIVSPAAKIGRHQPRGEKRKPSPILKSP